MTSRNRQPVSVEPDARPSRREWTELRETARNALEAAHAFIQEETTVPRVPEDGDFENRNSRMRKYVMAIDTIESALRALEGDAGPEEAPPAGVAAPRNCDVGTAEEQYARFSDWCRTKNCPSITKWNTISETAFRWAQSPYGGQLLPKRKTETEFYRDYITPQVNAIVGRYGGYMEGFGDEFRTVLFALSRYCLSVGHQLGYDEGRGDAKRGRDSRIDPKSLRLNRGARGNAK